MEFLCSMSACGHLESSSFMHLPSCLCSWSTSPVPGRLDARFTVPFINGISLQNGENVSSGMYQFSMHTDISGPASCGTICIRTSHGVCQMEKGVKGSGVNCATL